MLNSVPNEPSKSDFYHLITRAIHRPAVISSELILAAKVLSQYSMIDVWKC